MVHTMEDVLARVSQWLGQTQGSLFSFTQQNLAEYSFSVLHIAKSCRTQLFCPLYYKNLQNIAFLSFTQKILQNIAFLSFKKQNLANIDFLSFSKQNLAKYSFSVLHIAKSCKIQLFCPSHSKILQNIVYLFCPSPSKIQLFYLSQSKILHNIALLSFTEKNLAKYSFYVLYIANFQETHWERKVLML